MYELLIGYLPWAVAAAAAGTFAVRKEWKRAALTVAVALLVVPAVHVVPAGHRGVVYRLGGGVDERERAEGLALTVPWVHSLRAVNVRTQKLRNAEVFAQSRDLQEITVVASVNYHVRPDRAAELYRGVGMDYEQTIIAPALFQRMKAAVGQVLAVDFAENRSALADDVRADLEEQLAPFGLDVEHVNIEDAIFDPDFIASVKAKVIADEEAAKERRLIAAEDSRKRQAILQAEGRARSVEVEATAQAKANRRLARSITDALLTYRFITGWNGELPKTLVGNDDFMSLLLELEGN